MGSFAKRMGQMMAQSVETESANILKTGRANKLPGSLSLALDGTLKRGHDMKVFGLGTVASMASTPRYARFTASMYNVYSAMEYELDESTSASTPTPSATVWARHGEVLRRADRLKADLADVVHIPTTPTEPEIIEITPATAKYVSAIHRAGTDDRERGGGRLLGHLYCRYFADLFGGSMLAMPYNVALGLRQDTPRHYEFNFPHELPERREFIEAVYHAINEAGDEMGPKARDEVVEEAMLAFAMNVEVYKEEPIVMDSAIGAANLVLGGTRRLIGGASRDLGSIRTSARSITTLVQSEKY